MDQKLKSVLNIFKSKTQINEDIHLNVNLVNTNNTIPISDLSTIINSAEQEQIERNASFCYRLTGTLNVVASNVLFNISGDNSYEQIIQLKDFDEETETFVNDLQDVLLEDDGWFYFQTGTTCDKIYLEPTPDKFYPLTNKGFSNWNLFVTYPYSGNLQTLTFNNVPLTDGIGVSSILSVEIDERLMTAIVCPINHGLEVGDIIFFESDIPTGINGEYSVYHLGLDDGSYSYNIFIIDVNLSVYPPITLNTKLRFKKIINGVYSSYYARSFRKLTGALDYEIYPTGFALNAYNDQNFSFTYNTDLDLSDLTDYLGRPITELYLTIVKKETYNVSGELFWTNVESGIDTMLINANYDINSLNSLNQNDSIEENVNGLTGDTIFGDIVEYNPLTLTENVLQVAYHRFNTINRRNEGFLEGYIYRPHYKIQIKEFSEYIEESTNQNETVPPYAVELEGNKKIWRDIYSNSFTNSADIPFVNGCHYLFANLNVFVKRQDPCNLFNLGSTAIVVGNCDTNDKFTQEIIEDICK